MEAGLGSPGDEGCHGLIEGLRLLLSLAARHSSGHRKSQNGVRCLAVRGEDLKKKSLQMAPVWIKGFLK